MSKAYIKFLNPHTGKYESPTLEELGDVNDLKTTIKTNIVASINSMIENGVPSGEINEKLAQLETILNKFSNGQWTDEQLQSLIGSVESIIEIPLTEFQQGLDAQKAIWDAEVAQKLEDAKEDYSDRLEQTERVLTDASGQLDLSRGTLEQARTELNSMTLNVAGYEERFNVIDNSLETVVYENKFDLMTAEFIQNKKVSIETAEGIVETSISQILSAQDGRVAITESNYINLTDELAKKITHEELKGELDEYEFAKYGDNLLEGTRDFRDWELNGSILSAGTDYRQTKSVTLLSSARQIYHIILDLEVGKTYTVSLAYYYEGVGNPVPVMRTEGENYELTEIYEDTRQFNNWMVVYTQFVAESENQDVTFFVNNIPLGDDVKIACLKIEFGIKSSPWKPHINDTWYELELYDSRFIVQANAITSWLRKIAGDDDELLDQEALWQITAEGLLGQARTARKLEDGTYQQETADLVMDSERFSVKVGKTVSDGISEINVDNKNRIINSNYLFKFEQWQNVDPLYVLEKINEHNHAVVSRTGLSANNPVVLKSNKFKSRDGEHLMIGVSVYTPDLSKIDSDNIMRLELFDINDIRVAYNDFTISEMTGSLVNNESSRLTVRYEVKNALVAKGQITLQLPRNGHVGFSQLSVQNSDINITEWQPAPEDVIMIQLRMESWIEQDAESVAIGAIRQEVEKGREDDTSAFHEMWSQIKVTADNFDLSVKKDGIIQSINGSREELLIDFEKVRITGELLADLISTQYLDISKGLRIMNGKFPILQIDNEGNAILNFSNIKINHIPTLIQDTIDDVEVGGRNYFTTSTPVSTKDPEYEIDIRGSETPNGFKVIGGGLAETPGVRVSDVINGNGWWTVSFDIKGESGLQYAVNVDVNGVKRTKVLTNSRGSYVRKSVSVYVDNYNSGTGSFIDFDDFELGFYWIDKIKVERGNRATDWTPAPEDVQDQINSRADGATTESALNDAAANLQVLRQEVEAAATANDLSNFVDRYNKDMSERASATAASEESLSEALGSISVIEKNMGAMSETWIFVDRFIKNTGEGILIGSESTGSYILINEERVAFFSNGQEVAFISQNLMEISRGAFVEEIQVAKYKFEEATPNHLTVRFVG